MVLGVDGRVQAANGTLARWTGLTAEELHGRRMRDLLTVGARIVYETTFAPLLRLEGGFEEMALELVTAGEGKLPVLVSACERRDAGGAALGVRLTLVRANQRLGYERDLQGREAAAARALLEEQSASSLREQFIAVLGHDLRNPLASVSSGIRLLQRDPSKEKADQIASMMRASVSRMTDMIENVLDFARGRLGGGISLRRGPTDLEAAVLQVVDELRAGHPGRRIELQCSLPTLLDCDGPRLSQMLSNLVGNACTHGDPETAVEVNASLVSDVLQMSVTNGGAPIPESKIPSLFQPFSRDQGEAPKPGLGLGLFIASEIARAHGGAIAVRSSIYETRFTFTMPAIDDGVVNRQQPAR